jgi:hypothetical protein
VVATFLLCRKAAFTDELMHARQANAQPVSGFFGGELHIAHYAFGETLRQDSELFLPKLYIMW